MSKFISAIFNHYHKQTMKNTISFLIALAVIVSPGLIDQIPTYDFMPALVAGMEMLFNFLK
jgi:hypothetical protein